MMRSCIEAPAHLCSSESTVSAASSSAFSSSGPMRRSRLVSSLARMLIPNRWKGDVVSNGGSWNLPQLTAARRVDSALFTVATARPSRYAALNR